MKYEEIHRRKELWQEQSNRFKSVGSDDHVVGSLLLFHITKNKQREKDADNSINQGIYMAK
jgi:hypothetical protein